MADFVAVIRRAVDGLADNTPEMRARVYEKARSAVTRQLESMKPRPPEEMLRRQLDKLDAAIAEVENEHAEALPSLEEEAAGQPHVAAVEDVPEHIPEPAEAPVAPPVTAAAEPAPAPISVQQPVSEVAEAEAVDYETTGYDAQVAPYEDEPPREEPVAEGPSASWQPQPEPELEYHPVEREPEPAPQYHPIPVPEPQLALPPVPEPMLLPVSEPAPALLPGPEAAAAAVQEAAVEPASEPWQPRHDEAAERAAAVHGSRVVEAMPGWYEEPKSAPQQAYGEPPVDHAAAVDAPGTGHHDDPTIPAWAREEQAAPAEVPSEPAHELRSEPVHEVHEAAVPASAKPAFDEDVAVTAFDDFVRDDLTPMPRESWPEPKMPAATEDLSWDPAPFDDNSLGQAPTAKKTQDQDLEFDDFLEPLPAAGSAGAAGAGKKAGGKAAGNGRPSVSAKDIFDMETIEARRPAKAIRTVPRRKVNVMALGLGLLGLMIVAGGGFALWSNKDAISNMISGLTSSPAATTPGQTPAESTTAPGTPASSNESTTGASDAASNATTSDGSVNDKFTQRLLADGSEVDEGAGAQAGAPAVEGKSVSEQNVAASATVENGQAPAANDAGAVAAEQQALPVGGQKMFLYEERLGQSVPTAIPGTVAWSLKHEQGENGRIEPTVQAQIVVPDRNLSALLTLRRNTDPSLPASHLIEIVFSLPPGFEGGSIDNVQRIAMKQTEQDRGNALIAVPAKITDDFHMIALNDFPDAQKTNLDLLRSRNWIDIPLTYRNGRRALLTMDKGQAGVDAFNTAIREWAALGNTATNQQ